MNRNRLFGVAVLLALPGCAQTPKAVAPAPAAVPTATAAPQPLVVASAAPAFDPALFGQAQANLRALGYAAGKGNDPSDPVFQRALVNFQRDQGLPENGQLDAQVMEKLRLMRAAMRAPVAPPAGLFIYAGAASHRALALASPPEGFASDVPVNFLMPLKTGGQAVLHLTRKGASPVAITCRAGRMSTGNLPLGSFEIVPVDCRGDSAKDPQWHDLFSPHLGLVVQRETGGVAHDLIAIRPVTEGWPAAVRTGLDWALSHALDEPAASGSLQWSSTAVAPRFDIKVTVRIKGADAGLSKAYAGASCRRFELVQAGAKVSYPGIACQDSAGDWMLPGAGIRIARPVGHASLSGAALRSAAN